MAGWELSVSLSLSYSEGDFRPLFGFIVFAFFILFLFILLTSFFSLLISFFILNQQML